MKECRWTDRQDSPSFGCFDFMIPSIPAKEMVTDQHRYEDYNTGRERGGHAGVRGDEGRQNLREKTELGVGRV